MGGSRVSADLVARTLGVFCTRLEADPLCARSIEAEVALGALVADSAIGVVDTAHTVCAACLGDTSTKGEIAELACTAIRILPTFTALSLAVADFAVGAGAACIALAAAATCAQQTCALQRTFGICRAADNARKAVADLTRWAVGIVLKTSDALVIERLAMLSSRAIRCCETGHAHISLEIADRPCGVVEAMLIGGAACGAERTRRITPTGCLASLAVCVICTRATDERRRIADLSCGTIRIFETFSANACRRTCGFEAQQPGRTVLL